MCDLRYERVRGGRGAGSLAVALCVSLAASVWGAAGCASRGGSISYPTTVANGRPAYCDDDEVELQPGLPSAQASRCSYADHGRPAPSRIRGHVMVVDSGDDPGFGAGFVRVELRAEDDDGRVVGHAVTDAQGHFSLSVAAPAGEYFAVAMNAETGAALGVARVSIGPGGRLETPALVVRIPPLSAPGAAPQSDAAGAVVTDPRGTPTQPPASAPPASDALPRDVPPEFRPHGETTPPPASGREEAPAQRRVGVSVGAQGSSAPVP